MDKEVARERDSRPERILEGRKPLSSLRWLSKLTAVCLGLAGAPRRHCPLCAALIDAPGAYCPDCDVDLPRIAFACERCGVPMAEGMPRCAGCQHRPGSVDSSRIPFAYAYPLDRLVIGLKFSGDLTAAAELASLLLPSVAEQPRPDCLMPVPLYPTRLRERGYNQALEMARPIAARLGLPIDLSSSVRVRPTAPQVGMNARSRRRNVRGAFAVRTAMPCRHVAIIDDVVTTGSTVEELAKALKRAGARYVQVWALARGGLR